MGIWIIPFVVISFFGAIMILAWFLERYEWNEGFCRNCGNEWKYFDTDSQGGRGYKCTKCGNTIWVSWPFIDTVKVRRSK